MVFLSRSEKKRGMNEKNADPRNVSGAFNSVNLSGSVGWIIKPKPQPAQKTNQKM